jgi:hypothetical protein
MISCVCSGETRLSAEEFGERRQALEMLWRRELVPALRSNDA